MATIAAVRVAGRERGAISTRWLLERGSRIIRVEQRSSLRCSSVRLKDKVGLRRYSSNRIATITDTQRSQRLPRAARMLRRVPGAVALARAARYLIDAAYRDLVHLRLFHRDAQFQTSTQTWLGRYPHLFACLASRLGDGAGLSVLSFGCSTGAEVLSLREALPMAHITGIDISAHALRAARRQAGGPRVRFVRGARAGDAGNALYDVILCVAVLQRGELTELRPNDCSAFITFDKFERAILELDAHLKPGGLLALHHSNFRLADTRVAANYTPILSSPPHSGDRAIYGPDNKLLTGAPDRSILFLKDGG